MPTEVLQIPDRKNPVIEKIERRWESVNSMAGVGLDPDVSRIPGEIWDITGRENIADGIFLFNKRIIDVTAPYVVDFKINSNFYQGVEGRDALARTFAYLKHTYPDIVRIYDGKFADVGHTSEQIATEVFERIDADAILLNPYLGFDGIEPFTRHADKLSILCVNTSNPSASDIQELVLADGTILWRRVLDIAMNNWNKNGNIIPVLSATHSGNLSGIRSAIGQRPILLAGIGVQGGDIEATLEDCLNDDKFGVMISSSRAILYPEIAEGETYFHASERAIKELRDSINAAKSVILDKEIMGAEQLLGADFSGEASLEATADLHQRPEEIAELDVNKLFVLLLGPSGVGKSTLIRILTLLSDKFQYVRPCTTRPLREGETDKDFVDETEFDRIATEGGFASVNYMYGAKYGLRTSSITEAIAAGKIPILDFPLDKARQLERPEYSLLRIYIFPEGITQWLQRLREAGRDSDGRTEMGLEELEVLVNMTTPHPDIHFSVINAENRQTDTAGIIVGLTDSLGN